MNTTKNSRNPWPFAIAGFFVLLVAFIAAFITVAARHGVDLVRAAYYEDEIRYEDQIGRLQRTRPVQSEVVIDYDAARACIHVTLPASHAQQLTTGRIQLYRPSDARLDRAFELDVRSGSTQRVNAQSLPAGLWKVQLQWTVNGAEYYLDRSLVIGPNKS